MNFRSIALVVALTGCLALGVALLHARTERQRVETESAAWTAKNSAVRTQLEATRAELRTLVSEHRKRRDIALSMLPAADRARNAVGPLVAQLQQQRSGRPAIPPELPPPSGPNGFVFPELMGNLEYSTALHHVLRYRQSSTHRGRLEEIGASPETIEKVLDLLTDREMVHWDVASLYPENGRQSKEAREQESRQRSAIVDQIKQLLGEDKYMAFTEETTTYESRANADGTLTRTTHQVRDIPSSRSGDEMYVMPLERRLSYSSEPLTAAQKAAIANVYRQQRLADRGLNDELQRANAAGLTREQRAALTEAYRNRHLNGTTVADEDLQRAYEMVLSPAQLSAVNELRAEQEAARKRSKLPKTASFN
jgi:hypothetical protein